MTSNEHVDWRALEECLRLFNEPLPEGHRIEINIFDADDGSGATMLAGFFLSVDEALSALRTVLPTLKSWTGIYQGVQLVDDSLLPDKFKRPAFYPGVRGDGGWRSSIRYVYVDCDAEQNKGRKGEKLNSTDDEKAAAKFLLDSIVARLGAGTPRLVADTGNGYALYLPCSALPAESAKESVQPFLRALAAATKRVAPPASVDTSVHDLARVTRVWGTRNRKYREVQGRPCRMSRLVERHLGKRPLNGADLAEATSRLSRPQAKPEGTDGDGCDLDLAKLLSMLSQERVESREDWLAAGMALRTCGDDGWHAWREWSMRSSKWDEDDGRRVWESIEDRHGGVGVGTIVRWAAQDSGRTTGEVVGLCRRRSHRKEAEGGPDFELTRASEITIVQPRWLIPGWMGLGDLHITAGDPSAGKSLLAADRIANLTTGRLQWGEGGSEIVARGEPVGVVYITLEDRYEEIIVPRLAVHKADLSLVVRLNPISGQTMWHLGMIPSIAKALDRLGPQFRLVVIDPIANYLPPGTNPDKSSDVYRVMGPWQDFLHRRGITLSAICHLNKRSDDKGPVLYRVSHSLAWVGAAHAGVDVVSKWGQASPDEPTDERCVLQLKPPSNMRHQQGYKYRIVSAPYQSWDYGVPLVQWSGRVKDEETSARGQPDTELQAWIVTHLGDGQPMDTSFLLKAASLEMGRTPRQVRYAEEALKKRGFTFEHKQVRADGRNHHTTRLVPGGR